MKTSLTPELLNPVLEGLKKANEVLVRAYPGEPTFRQPVHVVYGGAQLFKADSARKLGGLALRALEEYAPSFVDLARALAFDGHGRLPKAAAAVKALEKKLAKDPAKVKATDRATWLSWAVHGRVVEKLQREPVEDFRIDFEDGYGNRPDAEEDGHAAAAAREVAAGMKAGILPPFIGIRIKPFNEELKARSIRTLDVFVSTLLAETGGKLPDGFLVTLPKVTIAAQVSALVDLLGLLENRNRLAAGVLKMEIMIETTQAILSPEGRSNLPQMAQAAKGRCVGAHFGTYDYTASCGITAAHQVMDHPSCDFALHMMKVAFASTGIQLSDGATNVMPVGPHRPKTPGGKLTPAQRAENLAVVHRAWKMAYDHTRHSLRQAFYQGWDLHPAQLPVRYAAIFSFFLESFDQAALRLRSFMDKAAQATLVGDVFDDAATGQGLLNYFLRALNSGAASEGELGLTGLSLAEIRTRSFVKILNGRKKLG